jgi:hypothetical protein
MTDVWNILARKYKSKPPVKLECADCGTTSGDVALRPNPDKGDTVRCYVCHYSTVTKYRMERVQEHYRMAEETRRQAG